MSTANPFRLPNSFYSYDPKLVSVMVTRKELHELLMSTGGDVLINGYIYDIKSKHMGAGAYKVTVKRRGT